MRFSMDRVLEVGLSCHGMDHSCCIIRCQPNLFIFVPPQNPAHTLEANYQTAFMHTMQLIPHQIRHRKSHPLFEIRHVHVSMY
jgi:hypothetical protein